MYIVHVHVEVFPEAVEAFKAASQANAAASLLEPGVVRFDVLQESEVATRFLLVEVYRVEADAAAHKETAHYATWRDKVAPMMAQPRRGVKYGNIFPLDAMW